MTEQNDTTVMLIGLISDDLERLPHLMEKWEEAGVKQAIMLDGSGPATPSQNTDDMSMFPSLATLLEGATGTDKKIILAIITQPGLADSLAEISRKALKKSSGTFFALPLSIALSIGKQNQF